MQGNEELIKIYPTDWPINQNIWLNLKTYFRAILGNIIKWMDEQKEGKKNKWTEW